MMLGKLHVHSHFTGETMSGQCIGTTTPSSVDSADNTIRKDIGVLHEDNNYLGGKEDDEEVQAEITALMDFVAGL